jgi:hypothetical protein
MPTLFIGLGPRGDVTEEVLQEKLDQICPTKLRFRGACAFCDVAESDAERLIKALNGTYVKGTKLAVKLSQDEVVAERDGDRRRGEIRARTRDPQKDSFHRKPASANHHR